MGAPKSVRGVSVAFFVSMERGDEHRPHFQADLDSGPRDFGDQPALLVSAERAWKRARTGDCYRLMGNSQGRDNVKKRARRRKKTERLALAKQKQKTDK